MQEVIKCELPVEELGFNSISELLQRVPGVDVSKPPDSTKLMVFCTTPISDSETESDSSERMSAKEKDAMVREGEVAAWGSGEGRGSGSSGE